MKWNKWRPRKSNGRGETLKNLRDLATEEHTWAMNGDTLIVVADRGDGVLEAMECKVLRMATSVKGS